MDITQSNLSVDQPCKGQRASSQPSWVCSDDALSGFFEGVARRAINIFDPRTTSEDLTKLSKRSVDSIYRVRLIDKLSSSNSRELSLVPVAQLNSEQVVIVPWIEAVRERTTAELSVWERTIDLLKHAVTPTVDAPALFHNFAFIFWTVTFVLQSLSCSVFLCWASFAISFRLVFFTLVLSSTESLFLCQSFQGSGFKGSSDKWEVKWYLVFRSPRGLITERWLAEVEKEPHPELQRKLYATEIKVDYSMFW